MYMYMFNSCVSFIVPFYNLVTRVEYFYCKTDQPTVYTYIKYLKKGTERQRVREEEGRKGR